MQTSQKTIKEPVVYTNNAQAAAEAGLRYLPDTKSGISRKAVGKNFTYYTAKGEKITDEKTLARIKKLVIPPAWTNVWICPSANGHIQATGRDQKGRKQYIYHPQWQTNRSQNKFSRLLAFAGALPEIRKEIEKDLRSTQLNRRMIIAIALNLLDQTLIRIGNKSYARTNKSYGLTTLRDRHVKINGSELRFEFIGKKGVAHAITLHDKKLAGLVKKCKDIPGYDLFQYYNEHGQRQTLESGDVNQYLKELTNTDFSAKDFRTWGGTVRMVACLEELIEQHPELEKEKTVKEAFKAVAKGLGNTPSVCSKYYVHPEIINMFHDDRLFNYLKKHNPSKTSAKYLSPTEELVLKMLKSMKN